MPEDAPRENLCPQCSKPLPPGQSPGKQPGLCPACLLKCGLETNTVGYTDDAASQGSAAASAQSRARWTPPTADELAPLFPELDILALIGRGGMGAVYKAREKQLDRLVALKILPPEIGREEAFATRFAREAQAMARLGHPNIVTIHSFGCRKMGTGTGGTAPPEPVPVSLYYFIMEYVDGLSLRQLLDAGTVSPKEALAIVPQICDALQYAHDRGIVHRDIKPENILLNRAGQVKIADFGLAKLVGAFGAGGAAGPTALDTDAGGRGGPGSSRRSPAQPDVTQAGGKVMGTPRYMAPEQLERPAEVDHRADIYSLGVVFYQMLTGELPEGGFEKGFEPPSRKVLIDVRLDEVVLRALEREPARRYQQVSDVRTQVETIVGTQPQDVTSPAERPVHPAVYGWEYRSKRTLFGLPLVHVANGMDPDTGRPREARGIIAYGAKATGVVAIGGRAYGVIAFGGFAAGLIAFGGFALGVIGYGGIVLGLLIAYGGLVAGPVALGGIVAGIYADGGISWNLHHLPAGWVNFTWMSFYILGGALLLGTIPLVWLQSRSRPERKGEPTPPSVSTTGLEGTGAASQPKSTVNIDFDLEFGKSKRGVRYHKRIPIVGVRDGRRAVHWPGILLLLVFAGVVLGVVAIAGAHWQALAVIAVALAGLLAVGIIRAWAAPTDQLTPLDSSHLPGAGGRSPAIAQSAGQAVKAPATGMIVAAGISLAVVLSFLALVLVRMGATNLPPEVPAGEGRIAVAFLPMLLATVLGIIGNVVILLGSMSMMQLRNRGLAITAAILALIAAPGNIIGLPMGIWALVVLSRREIINAFRTRHATENASRAPRRRRLLIAAAGSVAVVAAVTGSALYLHHKGQQNFCTIEGMVLDARTLEPIEGARVADNMYGGSSRKTVSEAWTDSHGRFLLKTWREEHAIAASAPGYQPMLLQFHGDETKVGWVFRLQPEETTSPATTQAAEPFWREALIPDADTKGVPMILDLASGAMLLPPDESGDEALHYFTRLRQGDIGFDRVIIILRGGRLLAPDGTALEPMTVRADSSAYDPGSLPQEALVKTGDGAAFRLRVVGVTPDGDLRIRYARAPPPGP